MATTDPDPPALGGALQPVVRRLVRDALRVGVGGTLPTNARYQRDHGLGAGTIQRALALLDRQGAVRTVGRGQLGRVVDRIDVGAAWTTAGLEPVRMLLPPAGAAEIDALQEVLAEGLTALGIPHTVQHRAGGAGRLAAVAAGGHDLAMVSAGALADAAPSDGPRRVLGPGSYYGSGRLVTVRRAVPPGTPSEPRRVGIDPDSGDHSTLTAAEFPDATERVTIRFPLIPAAVLRGEIDAGIWHVTRSVIPLELAGLTTEPLRRPAARAMAVELSAAALVGWAGRPELAAVLAELSFDHLPERQRALFAAEDRGDR